MPIILNAPIQGKNDVPSVAGSPVAVKSYTTAQVNALTGQDPGTIVWDSDALAHKIYDGVSWERVSSLSDAIIRARTAALVNVTKSGTQTINAVALVVDDVVLLTEQTAPVDNGPWVVAAGAWSRPSSFSDGGFAAAVVVAVSDGRSGRRTLWMCSTTATEGDVIGTDDLEFLVVSSSGGNWKDYVRAAGPLNAATPSGGGSFFGVTVATGDRVLITANGFGPTKTGIYVVNTAGDWTRPADYAPGYHAAATVVHVQEGTKAGVNFVATTLAPSDVVDTNTITWAVFLIGGREISPGTVIYDDNLSGGGISTSSSGIAVLISGGTQAWGIGQVDYPRIVPADSYSYLGLNPAIGAFYHAIGEATIRQLGSVQTDNPFEPTPTIAAVTPTGANNGVTRGYKLVAREWGGNGISGFAGESAASAQVSDANGPTVLDGGNFETITWVDEPGVFSYDVYLTFSSVGETLGKLGFVFQGTQIFTHTGQIGNGSTPPALRTPHVLTYRGNYQTITLTEDISLFMENGGAGFPVGGTSGLEAQEMALLFVQGTGGGWTITPPSNITLINGPLILGSAVGDKLLVEFRWDKTLVKWVEQSRSSNNNVHLEASASDKQLTTTGATDIAAFTPSTAGNHVVHMYYRVVTAATIVTITITWTDPSGAQSSNVVNLELKAVGSYSVISQFINATATEIKVSATAGTANQLFVSAAIERMG